MAVSLCPTVYKQMENGSSHWLVRVDRYLPTPTYRCCGNFSALFLFTSRSYSTNNNAGHSFKVSDRAKTKHCMHDVSWFAYLAMRYLFIHYPTIQSVKIEQQLFLFVVSALKDFQHLAGSSLGPTASLPEEECHRAIARENVHTGWGDS